MQHLEYTIKTGSVTVEKTANPQIVIRHLVSVQNYYSKKEGCDKISETMISEYCYPYRTTIRPNRNRLQGVICGLPIEDVPAEMPVFGVLALGECGKDLENLEMAAKWLFRLNNLNARRGSDIMREINHCIDSTILRTCKIDRESVEAVARRKYPNLLDQLVAVSDAMFYNRPAPAVFSLLSARNQSIIDRRLKSIADVNFAQDNDGRTEDGKIFRENKGLWVVDGYERAKRHSRRKRK